MSDPYHRQQASLFRPAHYPAAPDDTLSQQAVELARQQRLSYEMARDIVDPTSMQPALVLAILTAMEQGEPAVAEYLASLAGDPGELRSIVAGDGDHDAKRRYGWDKGPQAKGKPDGYRVWTGTGTDKGKRRVQIREPGTGRAPAKEKPAKGAKAKAPAKAKPAASAAKKPTARKESKAAAQAALAIVQSKLSAGTPLVASEIEKLPGHLAALTVPEITAVKKSLGLVLGKKVKQKHIDDLLNHARSVVGDTDTEEGINLDDYADKPAATVTPGTPEYEEAIYQEVRSAITELGEDYPGDLKLLPIHEFRQQIAAKYGDDAASHRHLDRAIKELAWQDKVFLVPISDLSSATSEQLADSIPGDNETFFSVRKPVEGFPDDATGAELPSDETSIDLGGSTNDAPSTVEEATASLESLYQSIGGGNHNNVSYQAIETAIWHLDKTFGREEVKQIAKSFGIRSGLSSKKTMLDAIEHKITERKARNERGDAIARAVDKPKDRPDDDDVITAAVADDDYQPTPATLKAAADTINALPMMALNEVHDLFPGMSEQQLGDGLGRLHDARKIVLAKDADDLSEFAKDMWRTVRGQRLTSLMPRGKLTAQDLEQAFGTQSQPDVELIDDAEPDVEVVDEPPPTPAPAKPPRRDTQPVQPARQRQTATGDPRTPEGAVSHLKSLYDRYDDSSVSAAELQGQAETVIQNLDTRTHPDAVQQVARGFGVNRTVRSKSELGKIVGKAILERKGHYDRSEQFSKGRGEPATGADPRRELDELGRQIDEAEKKPAPGKKSPDAARVKQAGDEVEALHAAALSPRTTAEHVESVVRPLEKSLSEDELREVARRIGIVTKMSKKKTADAIIHHIVRQKGAYDRSLV